MVKPFRNPGLCPFLPGPSRPHGSVQPRTSRRREADAVKQTPARGAREADAAKLLSRSGLSPCLAAVAGGSGPGRCSADTPARPGKTARPDARRPPTSPRRRPGAGLHHSFPRLGNRRRGKTGGLLQSTPGSQSLETPRALPPPRPRTPPAADKARLGDLKSAPERPARAQTHPGLLPFLVAGLPFRLQAAAGAPRPSARSSEGAACAG